MPSKATVQGRRVNDADEHEPDVIDRSDTHYRRCIVMFLATLHNAIPAGRIEKSTTGGCSWRPRRTPPLLHSIDVRFLFQPRVLLEHTSHYLVVEPLLRWSTSSEKQHRSAQDLAAFVIYVLGQRTVVVACLGGDSAHRRLFGLPPHLISR